MTISEITTVMGVLLLQEVAINHALSLESTTEETRVGLYEMASNLARAKVSIKAYRDKIVARDGRRCPQVDSED